MSRFLRVVAMTTALAAAVAAAVTLATGWTGRRLGTALFVAGIALVASGTFGFTGGTAQMNPFGSGSMGRGHAILAETHAGGASGMARRQGEDRAGRVSFAWVTLAAGIILGLASAVVFAVV